MTDHQGFVGQQLRQAETERHQALALVAWLIEQAGGTVRVPLDALDGLDAGDLILAYDDQDARERVLTVHRNNHPQENQ